MKKPSIQSQILLFLCLSFSPTLCWSQMDSVLSINKPEQDNYIIARYVIGSGGVLGATGSNYHHVATAGQTFAGAMQGANNGLLSGFWLSEEYGVVEVDQEEIKDIPKTFKLHQNYPNPFNPQTAIQYDLSLRCLVSVEIFNVLSQRIRLLSHKLQGPGNFQVIWNGRDEQGRVMSSGIYFYRVTAFKKKGEKGNSEILFQQTKKMFLIK